MNDTPKYWLIRYGLKQIENYVHRHSLNVDYQFGLFSIKMRMGGFLIVLCLISIEMSQANDGIAAENNTHAEETGKNFLSFIEKLFFFCLTSILAP